ncbi:MAG TPA: hypothetical protein VFP84_26935 [Kofleriaceae bacterium]|nr:hypothetical protein [Kofleriaceae bacterium]
MQKLTFVIAIAALVACGKSDKPGDPAAGSGAASAGAPRDAVIDAWKTAKLNPSAFAPAKVAFGKDCQAGSVAGVDVLVCNFATPAEAKAAEDAGLGWIGGATGASQARGSALIVVADHKKADPNGRMINQLLKLAPN